MDFVHDRLSNGRSYKMLTVLDEYTRQALCVEVRDKMGSDDVLEVMHRLLMKHGKPEFIRSDNGGEFVAQHLQDWLRKVGARPIQIYPGSPWENGYNERFNGILRQELLNTEWFHSVKQAQVAINIWLKEYNHIRPHHALGMRPPVPETFIRETRNLWYRNWGLDSGRINASQWTARWAILIVLIAFSAEMVHKTVSGVDLPAAERCTTTTKLLSLIHI